MDIKKSLEAKVVKVDESLGVVIGYAIICKELDDEGEFQEYVDLQDDHVTEKAMTECALEFMEKSRVAKLQHDGDPIGQVVFGLPLDEDTADKLGMTLTKTGFIVGIKPDDKGVLAKYASGELTGFSIGGFVNKLEDENAS